MTEEEIRKEKRRLVEENEEMRREIAQLKRDCWILRWELVKRFFKWLFPW